MKLSFKDIADADKMPGANLLDDMAASIAKQVASEQDALIRGCINERLNYESWTLDEIMPRMRCEIDPRNPRSPKIFTLDGIPLVEIWPVETDTEQKGASSYLKWTLKYRKL